MPNWVLKLSLTIPYPPGWTLNILETFFLIRDGRLLVAAVPPSVSQKDIAAVLCFLRYISFFRTGRFGYFCSFSRVGASPSLSESLNVIYDGSKVSFRLISLGFPSLSLRHICS